MGTRNEYMAPLYRQFNVLSVLLLIMPNGLFHVIPELKIRLKKEMEKPAMDSFTAL